MCTLQAGEEVAESKSPSSPSALGLGDKGTSTHNMFEALGEEERENGPPGLADSVLEDSEADSESETWTTGVNNRLKHMSQKTNRWNRWKKVEKGENESPRGSAGIENRFYP